MQVTLQIKEQFFDSEKVRRRLDVNKRKGLEKIGAFIRRSARSSLRRRKKPSTPGTPPSIHSAKGFASLKTILFAYNPEADSVIVGPVGLGVKAGVGPVEDGTTVIALGPPRDTVPSVHEFGGTGTVIERKAQRSTPTTGARSAKQAAAYRRLLREKRITPPAASVTVRRSIRYPARPFMGPAMQREITNPKLADAFGKLLG